MATLELVAHAQPGYAPRTRHNATTADLTAAFAFDYTSPGECLTRSAAGERYVALPLTQPPIESARLLFRALRALHARVLNVAGNSLPTLEQYGMDQAGANAYVCETLRTVLRHWPVRYVISGGQTGIDFAGGVAACALEVDAVLTFPPGFLQRGADGRDRLHNAASLRGQIVRMARCLDAGPAESGPSHHPAGPVTHYAASEYTPCSPTP